MNVAFLADHPEAVPIVARWYYQQWGHTIADNSLEKTEERLRQKLNRGDKVPLTLIALDEKGTPLGAAQLKIQEMKQYPDKHYWLGGVYVSPEARGAGLASRLAKKIIGLAEDLDIPVLHLQTERLDGGLYARMGWTPVERAIVNGLDLLLMERRISCTPD